MSATSEGARVWLPDFFTTPPEDYRTLYTALRTVESKRARAAIWKEYEAQEGAVAFVPNKIRKALGEVMIGLMEEHGRLVHKNRFDEALFRGRAVTGEHMLATVSARNVSRTTGERNYRHFGLAKAEEHQLYANAQLHVHLSSEAPPAPESTHGWWPDSVFRVYVTERWMEATPRYAGIARWGKRDYPHLILNEQRVADLTQFVTARQRGYS